MLIKYYIFQYILDKTNNHSLDDNTKQNNKGQAKNKIKHATIAPHI